MSDPTLTISYSNTAADLVLHAADGTTSTVARAPSAEAPTQAGLARPFLLTEDLRAALKAGTVSFVIPASPTPEQQALLMEVLRFLFRGVGSELIAAGRRMLEGERTLEKQRDSYNASHQQVTQLITAGGPLAAGAKNLADAMKAMLVPKAEQAAVTAAQQALDTLDENFLTQMNAGNDATSEQLQTYVTQRKALEAALAAAKATFAQATQALEAEFGAAQKELAAVAAVMANLKQSNIGTALSWTWTPPSVP